MTSSPVAINVDLVGRLIHAQFPQWADLTVQAVSPGGWDNRTFRLGRHMLVRLPSAEAYAAQLERERRWLPVLAPHLSQPIPEPLAVGAPCFGYPWRWSIYRWLEGDTALPERIGNLDEFARDLSVFLRSLHAVSTQGGPAAGPDTFHRGGSLAVYDGETRQAIAALEPRLNIEAATGTWKTALASRWMREPVWVHGDMGVGNLLVRDGRLSGVVDFGQSCVGDPACDLRPPGRSSTPRVATYSAADVRSTKRPGRAVVVGYFGRHSSSPRDSRQRMPGKERAAGARLKRCWPTMHELRRSPRPTRDARLRPRQVFRLAACRLAALPARPCGLIIGLPRPRENNDRTTTP